MVNSISRLSADAQGARIGIMRQIINMNTSDPYVMALFGNALVTLQQQGNAPQLRSCWLHIQMRLKPVWPAEMPS